MKDCKENIQQEKSFVEKIKSDVDFAEEIFKRGVIEGSKHSTPSPETLERLNKIETSLQDMMLSFREHTKRSEERVEEIVLEFKAGMKDVKIITELLSNASFMKNFFIKAGVLLSFVGGTYLLFRDIFHGQN